MIQQTIGNKQYTLTKVLYEIVGGAEVLTVEVDIVQELEFGVRKYTYGTKFVSQDEIEFFTENIQAMRDFVIQRLLDLNA